MTESFEVSWVNPVKKTLRPLKVLTLKKFLFHFSISFNPQRFSWQNKGYCLAYCYLILLRGSFDKGKYLNRCFNDWKLFSTLLKQVLDKISNSTVYEIHYDRCDVISLKKWKRKENRLWLAEGRERIRRISRLDA